jgi:hypothetical protein
MLLTCNDRHEENRYDDDGSLNDDDSPVDRLFLSDTELEEIKDNHQYINLQYCKPGKYISF